MSVTVANVSLIHTFDYWRERTNEIAHALTNSVVTAGGNTVTGNVAISGYFYANVIATPSLGGGNLTSSNTLTVTTNVSITANQLSIGNASINAVINSTSITVDGYSYLPVTFSMNTQTSGTSAQLVDSYASATYRTSDYILSVKDNNANAFHSAKALILHDGGTTYTTIYGVVYSNTSLGTFAANANATHVRLYITPAVANTQVKGIRTMVVV